MIPSYRESRRRARFRGAQAAYDLRGDPLWEGPDPEPEELDEPEEQPHVLPDGKGLEADQARDRAAVPVAVPQ